MTPIVADTLRELKLVGRHGLVFGNGAGTWKSHANIVDRGLIPLDCGGLYGEGRRTVRGKYTGLHALRHFYASWCINPKSAGGLGLSPKVVQERMGHSTIAMTLDVYGNLFPRGDEAKNWRPQSARSSAEMRHRCDNH